MILDTVSFPPASTNLPEGSCPGVLVQDRDGKGDPQALQVSMGLINKVDMVCWSKKCLKLL